jgi:hypothetical protein
MINLDFAVEVFGINNEKYLVVKIVLKRGLKSRIFITVGER